MKEKGFRVQLQADRHSINRYIHDKQALAGWVIDCMDQLSE